MLSADSDQSPQKSLEKVGLATSLKLAARNLSAGSSQRDFGISSSSVGDIRVEIAGTSSAVVGEVDSSLEGSSGHYQPSAQPKE